MTANQRSTVIGVFENHAQADRAVLELHEAGFTNNQIGVAARNSETGTTSTTDKGSNVIGGAVTGAAAGAGVGGLVALGILAGVIPCIGPAIAAGTLGVILANAAGGAAIAGLAGALIGLGIPEEEATHYEGEFKAGKTIVTVKDVGSRYDEVWTILHRNGAYNKQTAKSTTYGTTAKAAPSSVGSYSTGHSNVGVREGEQKIQLHEEQLHAQKQNVQKGEVRVRKEVVTENKTIDVPVTREEVVIERHAVNRQAASGANIRPGEEIRIPVSEEQVNVTKDTVVKEEVNVGKRQVQGTEKVGGTVRKEQVKVERQGNVAVEDENVTAKKSKR